MVAILESPAIRRQVQPMSVRMYEDLGERVFGRRSELIRGVVLQKMSVSPLHAFLVTQLRELISVILGPGTYCRDGQPIRTADSMPEPDLAVVAGQAKDHLAAHPATALLAVEVSISSLELDREKADLYAEAGIPEYWIVIGEQRIVEVYTAPQGSLYTQSRRYSRAETISSSALPGLTVELATLFPSD